MGQDFLSIFQLERKRLLWLIGITFAVILAFQYVELPYDNNIQPSVFSSDNISRLGSSTFQAAYPPSESEILNNMIIFNETNAAGEDPLETVTKTRTSEEKETTSETGFISEPGIVSNKSLGFDESDGSLRVQSGNGSATDQAGSFGLSSYNDTIGMNLTREVNITSESDHKLASSYADFHSPSHAITPTYLTPPVNPPTKVSPDITPPMLQNDSRETDPMEDERFRPLRDYGSIVGENSSITSVPKETKSSHIPVPEILSISEMSKLLLQNRASYRSMRPRWSSAVDQELLQARQEIENAPIVENVENLYPPLFRNVSMFKRSYELMEKTLKVYVYKEGAKPIMHSPYLLGIYASEGWFMRLMEANKRFVTKDPKKAHLFYLPFSSRRLEETLYVQDSHNHRNLIRYLNDYVDMISGKHRFWNRTGGADHFLVACHDWAPTETKQHMARCLRALCNSDVKEGFILGKDVSLPETYVRNSQNPTRNLGGKSASKREFLAFFAGGMHGYVRPILLQHWENKDPDMKIFGILPKSKGNRNYIQYMKSSKYCICAKGYEVNSPRVVEAIFYDCVPVIISDNFVPPFFEVLNWESFAVFVMEKDIPNLKSILLSIPEKRYLQMQMRVKKVQQHFLWHRSPVKYDIFHMILHSIWFNRVFTARTR
ncbi:Exostosin-like [Sesbania bispinosa]|nr:Exostosin-like [Sesbania bispinosa]